MNKILLLLSGWFFCFTLTSFSQNVGIGTTSPAERLHVAGNIRADTAKTNVLKITPNAGDGKILTSDANGNASWQSRIAAEGNIGYGLWGDCATNGNISEYNPVSDATTGPDDNFGFRVAISGSTAIVGAPGEDNALNNDRGSVNFLEYNGSKWILKQELMNTTGVLGDHFGTSVSISGNFAVVGTSYDDIGTDTDQGSATVYQYNGSSWVFMQKLIDATGSVSDHFGTSVAVSGNYIVIGTPEDDISGNANQGSACVFQYNGSNWVLMQKLTDAGGVAGDAYGYSVAISNNTIIVGAFLDDMGANVNQGSACVYQFLIGSWAFIQKITPSSGDADENFGYSVAVSGNDVIVGAIGYAAGAGDDQGAAYIFKITPFTIVTQVQKFTNPNPGNYDWFGRSVAISGDYAMVGADGDRFATSTGVPTGTATIYLRVGTWWGRWQFVTDPLGTDSDRTGHSTAIDASTKRFLIGNPAATGARVLFGKIN